MNVLKPFLNRSRFAFPDACHEIADVLHRGNSRVRGRRQDGRQLPTSSSSWRKKDPQMLLAQLRNQIWNRKRKNTNENISEKNRFKHQKRICSLIQPDDFKTYECSFFIHTKQFCTKTHYYKFIISTKKITEKLLEQSYNNTLLQLRP